jgi:iron(III) transport system permease protein
MSAAVIGALWLTAAPLALLLAAAFRGPGDRLPFEPEAVWTLEHVSAVYQDPILYSTTIPDTAIFVLGSVSLAFATAFLLAWLIERTDLPLHSSFFVVVLFPLFVPSVMLGIAWIQLFGPNAGSVNVLLRQAMNLEGPGPLDIFSIGGLIVCQAAVLVPFVFLLLSAALRTMNPELEEASSASGAAPMTTFRRVTWPVLRPGVLAALMLAALVTLEQFDLPLLIGVPARVDIFSTRIFYELNPDSGLPVYGRAAAVGLLFLAAAILLLTLSNRLVRQADRFVTLSARGFRVKRHPLGPWRVPAIAFVAAYCLLSSGLPVAMLIWTSLFGNQSPLAADIGSPTLQAYARLVADPAFGRAVGNTLLVATLSAGLVTMVGAVLAWILVRRDGPGRAAVELLSVVSIGIPSVIAGLATMVLYLTLPVPIYGTVWILVVAYSYRLAVATRVNRAGLMQIDPTLSDASAAAGASGLTTFRRILLPLVAPSLAASFILLFVVGVREFTLPLVLGSGENVVLGVVLWRLFEDGKVAEASALASLVVALVVPVTFVLRRRVVQRTEPA